MFNFKIMDDSKVFMFPNGGTSSSIDPGLLALINNNGGFGGNGYWIWILFLWMIWGGNGMNGNGQLQNMINNNQGFDMLMQALNGRFDNLGQLASLTNASVETVKTVLGQLSTGLAQVSGQVGMSGLQTINAVQLGNAALAQQLCQCCCENRLAIANQTNAIQAQNAANFSATQLQLAQAEAADQLAVCQQTNSLSTQADRNTNSILGAIANQNTLITKEFCDLKERELQDKINMQGDIITQLRGQISNDNQTLAFNKAMAALDDKIDAIAAKQPNTVPIVYPNLTAVNNTPYMGQGYYPFGNGFGNVVF